MKILHIVDSLDESSGGPSRSVPQTCEQLSNLGVEIELISRPSENPVKINTSKNFQVKLVTLVSFIKFCNNLSKKDVSIIHLQHVWNPFIHIAAYFARKKRIPYIITPRGMLEPWIMEQNSFKKKLGLFLYQRKDLNKAAYIHATCKLEETNIRNLDFKNPIKIIPNGVNITKFPLIKPTKSHAPKKILFLSRIHPKKGIELLIEAWAQIDSNKRKDYQVEIVGNGDTIYIEILQKKINDLQLEKELFVKEPVFGKEKVELFRAATLFILPTYSENFGIVIAEALASFTPVITTKGTPWEELNSRNCGWWIDLSVANLKTAILEALAKTPEQLEVMGKNGRKLVEEHYDVKAVAIKLKSFYNSILENNKKDD